TGASGTLNFAAGVGAVTLTVPIGVTNDTLFEASEQFVVNLSNATNAVIADAQGVATILDDGTGPGGTDNDTPTLAVSDVTVLEGTDPYAVFTVSLSNPSTTPVTFSLALTDGSATGADYGPGLEVSTDGGLTWVPGNSATFVPLATSVLVRTPIADDILNEVAETFTLTATVTAGTTINPADNGTGTINDLDNSLGGAVYVDANNNGTFDPGETPVSGATVTLTGTNDLGAPVSLTQLTDAFGAYDFTNLRPGTYTLTQTQPGGLLDGRDAVGNLGGTLGNDVLSGITTLASQTGTGYNFAELQPASISGLVFQDFNLDGSFNGPDSGIVGVTVTLTGTDDLGGAVTLVTATNPAGLYSFGNLRPGTYAVTETQPAGLADGADTVGSTGGVNAVNDLISGIVIGSGSNGTGYTFAEIFPFDPVKTIASTSNPGTAGSNLSIGEVVRYRIVVALPDGTLPSLVLQDQLPAGLTFLNDGTVSVSLISLSGSAVTSSTLAGPGLGGTNPSAAPTFLLPGSAISAILGADVDVYGSGTHVFFSLGDVTNTETGVAGGQFAVIEFNARVENIPSNRLGAPLDNTFRPLFDLDSNGTPDVPPGGIISNPATAAVAEPVLFLDKQLVSGSPTPRQNDILTFTVTIGHATGSNATAWEAVFSDLLPKGLELQSITTSATGGAVVTLAATSDANGALSGEFDIPVGGQIVITYRVKVNVLPGAGVTLVNAADVTWTSLSGNSPDERGSGDSLFGGGGLRDYEQRDEVVVKPFTFAFDSFNNFFGSGRAQAMQYGVSSPDIYRLPLLPLAPIYSGEADPGSTLVVTLYNTKGDIIGTQTVVVDAGGNWMTSFPTSVIRDYPNSVHISQSSAFYSLSDPHGHNLRTYYTPALSAGHFMFQELRMIAEGGSTPLLGELGLRNPLRLGAVKFGGELLPAQGVPGGY
ncbi:MAG: SdrD B-like domain-containing protein, partial [Chthoniobacteraceae bacterium]